ncbi:alpha/beta hydrolase [Paraflavitalea soli]|uniref:alpha/beta hydrolase n=1 Tax=Paraflavitalea soli TaxID=2315862 RepID=UPI0021D1A551|nr:alpha/beta hydrolase [Paraflavitalea soli]
MALDKQDGPTVLVGHSWGGVVITEAGNHPNVASLVYVVAFQPDNGETALQWFLTAPRLMNSSVQYITFPIADHPAPKKKSPA